MDFPVRTLAELAAAGVPASTVRSRVQRGRYRRLLPGVYAVSADVGTLALCWAVTRWRADAVLSHRTAAWVWGLGSEPDVLEATVPRRVNLRTPGWVRLHRRDVPREWVTTSHGMAVLTAECALVERLAELAPTAAAELVDAAPARGVNLAVARRATARGVGRPGAAAVRAALDAATPGAASSPERLLARALLRRGVRVRLNAQVGRYRCDLVDHATRTVVEVDGRAFHSAPAVFAADRRRQNALLLAGWLVLRYAAADVLADPDGVADEVAAVLRDRAGVSGGGAGARPG